MRRLLCYDGIMRRLYLTDLICYWQLKTYTASGEPVYEEPTVIKGRWDTLRKENQTNEKVETHVRTVTVFPDRVLVVGSVLMLGDEQMLVTLSPQEMKNPLLVPSAVTIMSQSTIAEFGWPQKANYPPGYKNRHLTMECSYS